MPLGAGPRESSFESRAKKHDDLLGACEENVVPAVVLDPAFQPVPDIDFHYVAAAPPGIEVPRTNPLRSITPVPS